VNILQVICEVLSFAVCGPTLWNSLPLSVRDPSLTLTQFCAHLKTMLFCRAYKTLASHLRDSLGYKNCCANSNSLTYLLTYLLTYDRSINRFFTAAGRHLWNNLPLHLRDFELSLSEFRRLGY